MSTGGKEAERWSLRQTRLTPGFRSKRAGGEVESAVFEIKSGGSRRAEDGVA